MQKTSDMHNRLVEKVFGSKKPKLTLKQKKARAKAKRARKARKITRKNRK